MRRLLTLFLLLTACLIGVARAQTAATDPSGIRYEPQLGRTLPLGTRFTDQTGQQVALRDIAIGRPTLLALGYYTCPALCGVIRDDLLAALRHTGLDTPADYQLIFLSIDPAETAADARRAWNDDNSRYPTRGAEDGWHFLVGEKGATAEVERAVGYHSRYVPQYRQFIHPAGIVVLTPEGRVSGYLLGVGYQPGDLRAAIVRASSGGVERAVQPVLLLCFHFDASTGRYTFAVMKALRLTGLLTVLTLLAFILLLRRGRRI